MDITAFVLGLVPSVLTGLALFYWQRAQKKRDVLVDDRAKARQEEAHLLLELQMANAKLSYANAMAIKRGSPNGEIEVGIEAYETAKAKYDDFLNEQVHKYLMN